ncbi:hypothetical protein DEU38_114109 [Rhodococcus sp. AG1013]|nr:hypothetical protein DEU38_114109 [Rhodococcus sp. AG1013]
MQAFVDTFQSDDTDAEGIIDVTNPVHRKRFRRGRTTAALTVTGLLLLAGPAVADASSPSSLGSSDPGSGVPGQAETPRPTSVHNVRDIAGNGVGYTGRGGLSNEYSAATIRATLDQIPAVKGPEAAEIYHQLIGVDASYLEASFAGGRPELRHLRPVPGGGTRRRPGNDRHAAGKAAPLRA